MTIIRKHEQLIAWQLGQELSRRVAAILSQSPARWDREYCSELKEAADAISANIAEGFDRYRLPGFRYFLEIANGSLGETSTRVRQGFAKGYFTERQLNELLVLCKRTRKLLTPLITSVAAEARRGEKRRREKQKPRLSKQTC
jgi:four helix bundle protein